MCGIAGVVHQKKKRFDKLFFNVLGIQNDSRGGDSCGIFIDGKIEYGFGKTALYKNFSKESKLLKETIACNVALLHCRKASVGGVTLDKAQPNIIKENDEIKFVVLHNGTIHNYKELAKKYIPSVNIDNMSDSQVFTRIFYETGYDVLGEYNGGAVFFIADYRGDCPRFFAWKGRSRKYYYANSDVEDERPFFYGSLNGSMYFSSIPDYLQCVDDNCEEWTIKPNCLCELNNGQWFVVKEFDRSKCTQSSYTPSNNYGYGGSHSTKSSNSNNNQYEEIDMAEYYARRYGSYCYGYGYDEDGFEEFVDDGYQTLCDDLTPNDLFDNENENQNNASDDKLILQLPTKQSDTNVIYDPISDLYYYGHKLCHGMYAFDSKGVCKSSHQIGEFYFWQGIILYNYNCFSFLESFAKCYGLSNNGMILSYPNLIHHLSPYPFKLNHEQNDKMFICDTPFVHNEFNGCITKLTEAYTKTYSNGELVGTRFVDYDVAKNNWTKVCNVDFDKLHKIYFDK